MSHVLTTVENSPWSKYWIIQFSIVTSILRIEFNSLAFLKALRLLCVEIFNTKQLDQVRMFCTGVEERY